MFTAIRRSSHWWRSGRLRLTSEGTTLDETTTSRVTVEAQTTHFVTEYEPALDGLSCTEEGVTRRRLAHDEPATNRPGASGGLLRLCGCGEVCVRRVIEKPKKNPDGRLYVRAYEDLSRFSPLPEGESAALVSDRAETRCILSGGAQ